MKGEEFRIVVQRGAAKDGLVTGKLSVNGKDLGTCYENEDKMMPAGTYPGLLRYKSGKGHVQGPGGVLSNDGDFLVEFTVPKHTDVLIHGGFKKEHSDGCILCGAVATDKNGVRHAPEVLKQLRLLFYGGNDKPNSSPNKTIVVEIKSAT